MDSCLNESHELESLLGVLCQFCTGDRTGGANYEVGYDSAT
jgi:hypothetical protein